MELVYLANCVLPSRSANTIQITKMCQAFARQGHDVTLLVPAHPSREADVEDLYDFYDVDPCFEIYKLARPRLSSVGTFLVNYPSPTHPFGRAGSVGWRTRSSGD
ncbi:hypothetical protein BRD08_02415 [Halobacteriales archaeon SW_10_66_29]|nr:MAG: hypothetical protein BRD08_02415 [Halobacteriales archaeon SW_10_66_29]